MRTWIFLGLCFIGNLAFGQTIDRLKINGRYSYGDSVAVVTSFQTAQEAVELMYEAMESIWYVTPENWEHREDIKEYLRSLRVMAIDMETATIFTAAFKNEMPAGALLLVSDIPMIPEGVKTEEGDKKVKEAYTDLHLRIGIDSLKQLINNSTTVKHLKF